MTNEEARAILEEVETIDDSMYQYNPAYLEALNMAIAALKAESCEDAVSREAFKERYKKWVWEERLTKVSADCIAFRVIDSLPPVTPKIAECEDAVKREAVLNTLDAMDAALDENRTVEAYKELLKECYKELPPITPKQKIGKWIKVVTEIDSFGNETYHHECSVCKCDKSGWGEYRFCPNCGAKMEGESE